MSTIATPITTVANVRAYKGSMSRAHYVGRPSHFGNYPGQGKPKPEALRAFLLYWYAPEQSRLRELARRTLVGHTLLCWCPPNACHADIIAWYLNAVVPLLTAQAEDMAPRRPTMWLVGSDYI